MTLYEHELRVDPKSPRWPDRDRFVLAKGHAAPALYVELAELGFFPKAELERFRQVNSILQGHPDMKKTPGVDMSTGSLGQGLSVATGIMVGKALEAADLLAKEGISAAVLEIHTIKPIDVEAIVKYADKTGALVTAEEHNILGGLGGAVAEVLGEHRPAVLERVGVADTFAESGAYDALLKKYGLTVEAIVAAARKALARL